MKRIIAVLIAALFAVSLPLASCPLADVYQTSQKNKKQKAIVTVVFSTHLHCENCAKKVRENIAYEKGVKSLEVSLEKQTITIGFDSSKTSVETLAAAIRKLGNPAEIQK